MIDLSMLDEEKLKKLERHIARDFAPMIYYVKSGMSAEILLETDDSEIAEQHVNDEGAIEYIVDGITKYWQRAYIDTVRQRKWIIREDDSGNLIALKKYSESRGD